MTRLRRMMLEELQRRNYAEGTTRYYVRAVQQFARHFGKSPDKLGPSELRRYQAYLLKERKLAVGTVVAQVAALRFFFVRTLKRQQFREDPGTPRRGGLLNSRPRQQLLSRSPVRGREPHLWTACHFSVYAARKDQGQLQRASRRGIHDYLRSLRRSERLSSEGNCRQGIRYLPRMLEPTRTKAARERQSEEPGNRLPTSAKNKQRTGR